MRRGPEIDHDTRIAPGQALTGAYVKRHARPAPVGNLGAQGDKGFGVAVRVHAFFFAVARCRGTGADTRRILAAHHVAGQAFGRPGLERAQHLELFVTDGVGMRVYGRLHADGAQQLQGMVLHHIAQGAGGFVKRAPAFHADLFGNRDLDIGDVLAPPQGFEQGVAKAQRKQVLHGGLAKVMVDAKNLFFFEKTTYRLVDCAVGGQVVA